MCFDLTDVQLDYFVKFCDMDWNFEGNISVSIKSLSMAFSIGYIVYYRIKAIAAQDSNETDNAFTVIWVISQWQMIKSNANKINPVHTVAYI